ncbi:hypothetical protein QMM58_07820 [Clostridioides difficile]|nr:hypothetical protein [Clostridioides difficile]
MAGCLWYYSFNKVDVVFDENLNKLEAKGYIKENQINQEQFKSCIIN